MGQFISKEEGPVAEKNFMDLPDETLLKIMGYLSNKDVLKNVGQVSKRFHRLSRDPFLIKKIEFKIPEFTYQWMFLLWPWTDERKKKYFNDFLEVVKNSQNLKLLSLQLDEQSTSPLWQSMRKILPSVVNHQCLEKLYIQVTPIKELPRKYLQNVAFIVQCPKLKVLSMGKIFPSGNHQCLEELYIQVRNVELDLCPDYLENGAFKVLDQCLNLKVLKIDIYLSDEIHSHSHFLLRKIYDISLFARIQNSGNRGINQFCSSCKLICTNLHNHFLL